jgi:hypothetical protein
MKWYCCPGLVPAEERIKNHKEIDCFKRNFLRNGEGMTLKEYLACKFANMAVAEIKEWPEDQRKFFTGCDLPFSACGRCGSSKYGSVCIYETIRIAIINTVEIAEEIQPDLDRAKVGKEETKEGGEA